MDTVSIDLEGPFRETSAGDIMILVAIDNYSKWAEALCSTTATAQTCAHRLYERFFSKFGFPLILLSDRGSHLI